MCRLSNWFGHESEDGMDSQTQFITNRPHNLLFDVTEREIENITVFMLSLYLQETRELI